MPSTPSTRLRLELQALGENLNSWGDTRLNSALQRLEEGIAGLATIPIAGAATVLTSSNYSADQARNACLVFTGTLTANSTVTVPNVEKLYLAVNNTTQGAYSLTLKTAAGAGYALRPGPQWVRCDGSDVSSATPRLDQLPLPTAEVDANAQRITNLGAPSAATDAATKTYVDTVASGAAAQYRPADGTVSAPAYSFASDTDSGVYRVGADSLGVSTGGVLRATVDAAGAAVVGAVTSTTAVQAGSGAVGAPSLGFTTDPDTGIYRSAANTLGFAVGGAVGMTLNGSGDLGLGQTPINNGGYRTITVGDTAGGAIELTNSGTMKGRLFYEASTDNLYLTNNTADGEIYFGTGGSTARMFLMSSGDLRIGQITSSTPGIGNTTTGFSLQQGGRLFSSAAGGSAFNLNSDGQVMSWARSGVIVGGVSVTTTATTYATSSDYRLKQDVQPLTGALDRLAGLKPSRFRFRIDPAGPLVDGFIAHEAQEIVPEAVTGEHDGDEMQGIDQSKLVPLLTAALQELAARVAELEAR